MNATKSPPRVTIFGTVHQIQGAEKAFWKNIEDPEYLKLLSRFLRGKDFVFEEASGLGPTKAEQLTVERLGAARYLDIDPHVSQRAAYGIGTTGEQFPLDPYTQLTDFYHREFEAEQYKRESHWLAQIGGRDFSDALLVCGYLHTLSLASRNLSQLGRRGVKFVRTASCELFLLGVAG